MARSPSKTKRPTQGRVRGATARHAAAVCAALRKTVARLEPDRTPDRSNAP